MVDGTEESTALIDLKSRLFIKSSKGGVARSLLNDGMAGKGGVDGFLGFRFDCLGKPLSSCFFFCFGKIGSSSRGLDSRCSIGCLTEKSTTGSFAKTK